MVGASLTGATSTLSVLVVVARSALLVSRETAVTVSWMVPLASCGGVNFSPASWPGVSTQCPVVESR